MYIRLYSQALRFSTFLSQTGNSQALACFSFNRKIIFYGSLIIFLIFSKESLFSFAEGSFSLYSDLFRQRLGSAQTRKYPKGTSFGEPLKKLDQKL